MTNNEFIIKEWYTKNEILKIYPIGIKTYQKRIKILNEKGYEAFTRFTLKDIPQSNLKFIKVREIHKDVINELFGSVRTPSINNGPKIVKWINNNRWDWLCNIVPMGAYPTELKSKIKYVHDQLKKDFQKMYQPILFYNIENNSNDKYFHCHFLIKFPNAITKNSQVINKAYLESLLEIVCEPNSKQETRIWVESYDYNNFKERGSDYSAKCMKYGYGILK
ncbi:MAG: hypothetical protein WCG74_12505 [Sediminibacterium sp.]